MKYKVGDRVLIWNRYQWRIINYDCDNELYTVKYLGNPHSTEIQIWKLSTLLENDPIILTIWKPKYLN